MKTYKEVVTWIAKDIVTSYRAGHNKYPNFDAQRDLITYCYDIPGGVVLRDINNAAKKEFARCAS